MHTRTSIKSSHGRRYFIVNNILAVILVLLFGHITNLAICRSVLGLESLSMDRFMLRLLFVLCLNFLVILHNFFIFSSSSSLFLIWSCRRRHDVVNHHLSVGCLVDDLVDRCYVINFSSALDSLATGYRLIDSESSLDIIALEYLLFFIEKVVRCRLVKVLLCHKVCREDHVPEVVSRVERGHVHHAILQVYHCSVLYHAATHHGASSVTTNAIVFKVATTA